MFERFKTKSKLITTATFAVLSIVLYSGIFWVMGYVQDKVQQAEDAHVAEDANSAREQKLKKLMEDTLEEQQQIASYTVSRDRVVAFIEEVESLLRRSGVSGSVDNVTTSAYPNVDAKKWEGLSVVISATGSWVDTYQFLSLLEHLPYKSNVIAARIQKDDSEKTNKDVWESGFTLVVLKQK